MPQRLYPLALHKNEWERLKKQSRPIELEGLVDQREEYFNALNEQSQKWIHYWPDSAAGVREKQEKLQKDQLKKNKALVDAFRKSRKHDNTKEAVERAKQIIFDNSCYGRQLISAEYESRAIVEREAQIAFQKEIKLKEAELVKDKIYADSPLVSNLDEKEKKAIRKLAALECVKINKEMEQASKEKAAKLKVERIQCEGVDNDMVKQFQDAKLKNKAELKRSKKQEIEAYEAIRKEVEKHRRISEDRNNDLIEVYKKEQDRIQCKIAAVHKKIIEESRHGERAIKLYTTIDELQKAEKKKYVDFVEKAIVISDERNAIQERKDIEIEIKKRAERCKISEENKIAGEIHKLFIKQTPVNKCVCNNVETLLVKPDSAKFSKKIDVKSVSKSDSKKGVDKPTKSIKKDDFKKDKLTFLQPSNKLVQALKRCEKIHQDTSGYTGAASADKYFAQQASEAIQRTDHKIFVRKVVREYLKVNGLKPSDLPVSNY